MSFLSILEKLKAQKETLKMEVLPGDPTARVKAGMINQAKFQIEQLKEDFRDEAIRRSVVILVFGPRAAQTVKILNEDFDVKVGNPRSLASKVVDKIDKSLYDNKQLHPSVIDMATSILDDIAKEPEWLAHVHLADTGRYYPGSGSYPLQRLFAILKDIGYHGMASVECRWGDDFTGESAKALEFLRKLTA